MDALTKERRMGGYGLEAKVGGTDGRTVWRARAAETDEPAIVSMLEGAAGTDREREFLREATAAAACPHPFIVAVREIGYTPEGAYWAADPIGGELLGDRILSRAWGLNRRMVLFFRLCAVMDALRNRGVVVDRVTPDDVFVMDDDVPKIFRLRGARFLWDPDAWRKPERKRRAKHGDETGWQVRVLGRILESLLDHLTPTTAAMRLRLLAREAQAGEMIQVKDLIAATREIAAGSGTRRRRFGLRAACL